MGGDILVGDTIVGLHGAVGLNYFDRTFESSGYAGYEHYGSLSGLYGAELHCYSGTAVSLGGLLDHVQILFAADAGYDAVIFDSYEQMAAVVVGECRYRACYLACVAYQVFEVLMLMFALIDKLLQVA